LPIDQYKALLKAIPEVNAALRRAGVDVGESAELEGDRSTEELKPKTHKKKPGKEKSNIEETSDEDDEE
jgi:hypothetical protein